ncbi:3-hexulose-6-phosphate synthase [Thermoflavimicrobium dichotomicum]|uniref:3-hexulose-6-phosphate synthase n=1 Tax=Thermoflavimicrobium dichotomicum TaxID=46223 RepID=A0A1I3TLS6_9BACL|nr:3-hexulose-6-phosphate synthase [Thermoflavimicrobium dichotomicum]SFJ71560.1 3-hexulose-6-phosphate synthase [Thermoflavimicrobium dichotomicum]
MKIQLALDRMTIEEAVQLAEQVRPYVDWIEVGTSMIKEFGMESVRVLRTRFPEKCIVADMKTFDNAAYEFEMCYSAGADVATVMGAAPLVTVETCMEMGTKHGKQVMIDLLHTSEIQRKMLSQYKEAIFCVHVSKDQQEKGDQQQSADSLHSMLKMFGEREQKIALAGGISLKSLPALVPANPDILIIGSAITKAAVPVTAASSIREFLFSWKGVSRDE